MATVVCCKTATSQAGRLKPRRRWCRRAGADASEASSSQPSWRIKMLYDGECPLCMREVEMLMKRVRPSCLQAPTATICWAQALDSWMTGGFGLLLLPLLLLLLPACPSLSHGAPPASPCSQQDQGKGRIAFVDVASPEYDPAQNSGISFEKAMEASQGCGGDDRAAVSLSRRRAAGVAWLTCSHYTSPTCHPALQRIHAIEADGRVITDVEVFR